MYTKFYEQIKITGKIKINKRYHEFTTNPTVQFCQCYHCLLLTIFTVEDEQNDEDHEVEQNDEEMTVTLPSGTLNGMVYKYGYFRFPGK